MEIKLASNEPLNVQKGNGDVKDLTGAYFKPSGGIPAADLSSGVIPTVPTISTDISSDASSDTKTTSPKAVKTYVDGICGDIETILQSINGN